MSGERFQFASGNLEKLLAVPKYLLSWLFSFFVARDENRWAFGSGIGVAEGALEVARTLRRDDPQAQIVWLVADESEAALAAAEGFEPIIRRSRAGYWQTLRAGQIVITHGLGDVNRFGVFGGRIVHLIHGAPLKKLHLDSAVTTSFAGPAPLRAILARMYRAGTQQIALFVAGSITAAERLRSAYRVEPGKVQVLGDPRDDQLCAQARNPEAAKVARDRVRALLELSPQPDGGSERLVLYAPTWRDGAADPAGPTSEEIEQLHSMLQSIDARLLIRSHALGAGAYDNMLGDRVHLFGSDVARDVTPLLGAFDSLITDYSSIAVDYALLSRPIVWFAPDLTSYVATRGLYEPLEVTAAGMVQQEWSAAITRLQAVLTEGSPQRRAALVDARQLAHRFHAFTDGNSARRVIAEIKRLGLSDSDRIADDAIFFESFYGRQVSCNPYALDREIARVRPQATRYWSVTSERIEVPPGAVPLLVGSADWFAARRRARLLVVNDWLRFGFTRARHQTVLQTWHGTMLKHLALGRPDLSLRTRFAIRRESRRWSLLLSQNPHSTEQFRSSYAFRGEILELGYPRDDRLADAVAGDTRIPVAIAAAKRALGVPADARVLSYTPTWRASGQAVDTLDVHALAEELGENWVVIARGHTRSATGYLGLSERVIDASAHPDINDVILAADLLVTDYSSVMFDAAVARVPMLFFVPDLIDYRDKERGFTFDFEKSAPGPLVTTRAEVVRAAQTGVVLDANYDAWRRQFCLHDDGHASQRVVEALIHRQVI